MVAYTHGDPAAFDELFGRYERPAYAFLPAARRVPEHASDLFDEDHVYFRVSDRGPPGQGLRPHLRCGARRHSEPGPEGPGRLRELRHGRHGAGWRRNHDLRLAIDVSRAMLERSRPRARSYGGSLELVQMDARALAFPDACFDTVASVCTFCSVPDPVRGLRELARVLKPGGRLLLFEHVRSRLVGIAVLQDLLTPLSRRLGPDLNRDTVVNVERAGFRVVREENVYLDIVKAVVAVPTAAASA